MTRCEDVQPKLSEFVDGTLDREVAADVAGHVDGCEACRGLSEDLERVSAAARSLSPLAPPDHLWLEVAGQVRATNQLSPSVDATPGRTSAARQWLGLAAALVVITIGAYAVSRVTMPAGDESEGNAAGAGSVETVKAELDLAMEHYENAIAELTVMATGGDDSLAPEAAAKLRDNIEVIDAAIAESRAALSTSPTSRPARASLLEALSQKVTVLQATVRLMNRMRVGDPEGAAAAVADINRQS